MDNKTRQTTERDTEVKARNDCLAKRSTGAPSCAYFFTTMGACMLCVAVFAAFFWLARTPDGAIDPMALHRWEVAHPMWAGFATIALAAICVAMYDLLGWKVASRIAWRRYRENITVLRVASWRLAIQTAFAAFVMLLYVVFPTKFPNPNGRSPYMGLGFLCVPIALAAIQLLRAQNIQNTKE